MNRLGIFPWPQWLNPQQGTFSVRGDGMSLWLGETCRPVLAGTTPVLDVWRVALPTTADAGRATVVIGGVQEPEVAARLSRHPGLLAEALPAEGYVLAVDDAGVTVGGADARGCLYGLSTVAQLIGQQGAAGSVPYLELRDWPHKPMRGAHVYMPGRDDIPYFRRLLAWLAALKYNYLFLEVGGGMRYDRHPEVNEGWARFCDEVNAYPGGPPAMQGSQSYPKDSTHTELGGGRWLEKEEVADLVGYANSLGIEVVPEMQSLSHAYYLVVAHPEIAERPYDPWPDTYCPSNPKSYELYFDLLDEVIEVLHPRMVHIGHDEAYTIGLCDRCRSKSGAELLAGDLRKIHDYLADRGIRTVLWGEKLQNLIVGGDDQAGRASHHADASRRTDHTMRETYQAVDFVPKDLLIFDWYWAADPYSERLLPAQGLPVSLWQLRPGLLAPYVLPVGQALSRVERPRRRGLDLVPRGRLCLRTQPHTVQIPFLRQPPLVEPLHRPRARDEYVRGGPPATPGVAGTQRRLVAVTLRGVVGPGHAGCICRGDAHRAGWRRRRLDERQPGGLRPLRAVHVCHGGGSRERPRSRSIAERAGSCSCTTA